MAVEAGDIVWRILGDLDGIQSAYAEAKAKAESTFGAISGIVGPAMTAAGAAITGTLTAAVLDFTNTGDAIQNMSDKTGLSTEAVSEWKHAIEMTGGSLGTLQPAMKAVSNLLTDAAAGGEKSAGTLGQLGLSVQQLQAMTPDQTFNALAQAVANVQDPFARAAMAQDVFGKGGMDLLPLLKSGAAGINELKQEAHDLGIVFDAEAAAAGDQFNDDLERLTKSVRGVGMELAKALVPALISFMQSAKDVVLVVAEWVRNNPQLAATITAVTAVMGGLMLVVGPLLMMLPGIVAAVPLVGAAFAALAGPIGIAIAAVAAVAAAVYFLVQNWEDIPGALAEAWQTIVAGASAALQTLGTVVGGAMAWVAWAFLNPIDAIIAGWTRVYEFFKLLWAGIAAVFQTGWEVVKNITDGLGKAWDWVVGNIGEGIAAGQTGSIPALASGGTVTGGGWALVGERGPELVQLPGGSTVYDAGQTAQGRGGGGGVTINAHFGRDSVRSDDDIRTINQQLAGLVQNALRGYGYAT